MSEFLRLLKGLRWWAHFGKASAVGMGSAGRASPVSSGLTQNSGQLLGPRDLLVRWRVEGQDTALQQHVTSAVKALVVSWTD